METRKLPELQTAPPNYTFEGFLDKLGAKDKLNATKHVAACEMLPDSRHAPLWQRLVCSLMRLSGHSAKLNGQRTAQFYVPDGKYRMQVFALEDTRTDALGIYCGDVLDEALKSKVLERHISGTHFQIADCHETLEINRLDSDTINPQPFFKDLVGWNRRALHITLAVAATPAQINAVEEICALSARRWHALDAVARV